MNLAADSTRYRQLRRLLCAALLAIVAIPGAGWLISRADATPHRPVAAADIPQRQTITAPGRIEPRDGVLAIAAPASDAGPAIVAALQVHEGDWVESGAVLATLSGRQPLEAALVASERRIAIARARLVALQAGAKEDDLRALRAEVESAQATLDQAQAETRRAQQLRDKQLLSVAAVEAQESRLAVAARTLEANRARLDSLARARPADLAVAEAELRAAEADADAVRAQLETTVVRAPSAGRVLALYAHPGQSVGAEGVLAFGRTGEMFVDAEIVEEDLGRLRVGGKATVTSDVLASPATGTVEKIGYLVGSREVFVTDPTAFTDSRIVHVKIRMADAACLERLINARVTVEIHP
jgi:HlyD family secretion protein